MFEKPHSRSRELGPDGQCIQNSNTKQAKPEIDAKRTEVTPGGRGGPLYIIEIP